MGAFYAAEELGEAPNLDRINVVAGFGAGSTTARREYAVGYQDFGGDGLEYLPVVFMEQLLDITG